MYSDVSSFEMNDITPDIVDVIETVISSLQDGNGAFRTRNDEGYLWMFSYGTVDVNIQLTGITDEDILTVWSKVLELPAQNEPNLMRKLLEMNWSETFESRFCIVGNDVAISSTRVVADLSAGEISRNITVVATIADEQDEILEAAFGNG